MLKYVHIEIRRGSKEKSSDHSWCHIPPEDSNNIPVLDFARDIFLFSFYMREMSFIAIAYLKKKDLSNGCCNGSLTHKWLKGLGKYSFTRVSIAFLLTLSMYFIRNVGFMYLPSFLTTKCKWKLVLFPVFPLMATISPAFTKSPGSLRFLLKWQ